MVSGLRRTGTQAPDSGLDAAPLWQLATRTLDILLHGFREAADLCAPLASQRLPGRLGRSRPE
jgi:hypothetical protein